MLIVRAGTSARKVPVTVTLVVPVPAVAEAVSVRVEVALPFAGGVTGLVENAAVTPAGNPEALSVVALLKPARLVIVMVLVPFPPCAMLRLDGAAPIEKSGVWTPPQFVNL